MAHTGFLLRSLLMENSGSQRFFDGLARQRKSRSLGEALTSFHIYFNGGIYYRGTETLLPGIYIIGRYILCISPRERDWNTRFLWKSRICCFLLEAEAFTFCFTANRSFVIDPKANWSSMKWESIRKYPRVSITFMTQKISTSVKWFRI